MVGRWRSQTRFAPGRNISAKPAATPRRSTSSTGRRSSAHRRRGRELDLIEASLRARGPYSLRLSTRHGSDATRVVVGGVLRAVYEVDGRLEIASARQQPDGVLLVQTASEEAVERMRFTLGLDDDHSEFVDRFSRDPFLGETVRRLRGLRPLRCATVTQALLRALCGQLITARRAREIERRLVGDLGLIKLLARLRGRQVEGWETAELLEPYGEWAGLASVYMLAGLGQGTIRVPQRLAA